MIVISVQLLTLIITAQSHNKVYHDICQHIDWFITRTSFKFYYFPNLCEIAAPVIAYPLTETEQHPYSQPKESLGAQLSDTHDTLHKK